MTPTRTAVVSAVPRLVPLGLALGSMSHRTARPQVPPSGRPEAFSSHCTGLKCACKKRSLLSFLNVHCLRWHPSVLHAAFRGPVTGDRLSRVALGFCTQGKTGVQKRRGRRENGRLSMVLYEDPFGGALATSPRDSWETGKKVTHLF